MKEPQMLQQFNKFQALGEGGREFLIFVFYDIKEYRTKNGVTAFRDGPYFETSEGYKVEKIDKGQYWIKNLDLLVMSDDPNAI
jgi:hypothetical protein